MQDLLHKWQLLLWPWPRSPRVCLVTVYWWLASDPKPLHPSGHFQACKVCRLMAHVDRLLYQSVHCRGHLLPWAQWKHSQPSELRKSECQRHSQRRLMRLCCQIPQKCAHGCATKMKTYGITNFPVSPRPLDPFKQSPWWQALGSLGGWPSTVCHWYSGQSQSEKSWRQLELGQRRHQMPDGGTHQQCSATSPSKARSLPGSMLFLSSHFKDYRWGNRGCKIPNGLEAELVPGAGVVLWVCGQCVTQHFLPWKALSLAWCLLSPSGNS